MGNMVYIGGGKMGYGGQDRTQDWPDTYGDLAQEHEDVEYRSASLGMNPDPVIAAMVRKAKADIDRDFAMIEARFLGPLHVMLPVIGNITDNLKQFGCTFETASQAIRGFRCHISWPITAPWPDFKGQPIRNGDFIQHPSGEVGQVLFIVDAGDPGDQWRVDYGGGDISRLCLQIGDKGQATVIRFPECCDDQTPAFDPTGDTIYCLSCDTDLMTNSDD